MARARPSPTDPAAAFVERMGRVTANEGVPRIAGRIFALLLVSEHEVSLDEIAARLGASKGSVSPDARFLEQRGLLELVRRPGDRRDYYRVAAPTGSAAWKGSHSNLTAGGTLVLSHRQQVAGTEAAQGIEIYVFVTGWPVAAK